MSLPAALLAGGLATRLRPVTETIPKALVEVAGRPFAEHQVEWLRAQGVERIVLCIGYRGEMIQDLLGDGRKWNVSIEYAFDGDPLLGTGGALRRARPLLGPHFFVMYGDSYLDCDLTAIARAFHDSSRAGLMTVFRNDDRWDLSNVQFEHGAILRYDKRNRIPEMHHIDYGLGVLSAQALEPYPGDSPFDLASVYRDLLAAGELAGYEVASRFYEIGSPEGLAETRSYLERRGKD